MPGYTQDDMNSKQRHAVHRRRIIGIREAGHSITNIVRDVGITRQTVKRWLTHWKESDSVEDWQQ